MTDPERDEHSLEDYEAWRTYEDTAADLKETINSDTYKKLLFEYADFSVAVSDISPFSISRSCLPKELRDQLSESNQFTISALLVGLFRPNPHAERTQPGWQLGARFIVDGKPIFIEADPKKLTLTTENTGQQQTYPTKLTLDLMAAFLLAISKGYENPKQFYKADRIDLPFGLRLEEVVRLISAHEGDCSTSAISSWIDCGDQSLHIHQKERGVDSPVQDCVFTLARQDNSDTYADEFHLCDYFDDSGEQRQALDIKMTKTRCSLGQYQTLTHNITPHQMVNLHPTKQSQLWLDLAKNLSRVLGKLV
jgi:hypothetical protein